MMFLVHFFGSIFVWLLCGLLIAWWLDESGSARGRTDRFVYRVIAGPIGFFIIFLAVMFHIMDKILDRFAR